MKSQRKIPLPAAGCCEMRDRSRDWSSRKRIQSWLSPHASLVVRGGVFTFTFRQVFSHSSRCFHIQPIEHLQSTSAFTSITKRHSGLPGHHCCCECAGAS